ncbi:hypothetical protein IJ380_01795 [Candidatus Saccharibacteria bacterium]|nr:hypothetical protein [Candidatus Saccharibacteria bacterium]
MLDERTLQFKKSYQDFFKEGKPVEEIRGKFGIGKTTAYRAIGLLAEELKVPKAELLFHPKSSFFRENSTYEGPSPVEISELLTRAKALAEKIDTLKIQAEELCESLSDTDDENKEERLWERDA